MNLSEFIMKAYRNNAVIVAHVYGPMGFGKTSYALWTAYEVYKDWNKVLKHLYFHPRDFLKAIAKAIRGSYRIPLVILDDAGLWLDRMTWWEKHKVAFIEFFNLIRSVVAGVIFTTPSRELPRQLIDKIMIRVHVEPVSPREIYEIVGKEVYNYTRSLVKRYGLKEVYGVATGYAVYTLPSFMTMVSKQYYGIYPLFYPNDVYREYNFMRQQAVEEYFHIMVKKFNLEDIFKEELSIENLVDDIKKLLRQAYERREIVKLLMKRGYKRSTIYKYLKLIMEEKKAI